MIFNNIDILMMVINKMHVKILLNKVRKEKNISLTELSKLTGISKSHLSYIERGEKEPSISMLCRIAIALKVDIKELYEIVN